MGHSLGKGYLSCEGPREVFTSSGGKTGSPQALWALKTELKPVRFQPHGVELSNSTGRAAGKIIALPTWTVLYGI